MYNHNEKKQIGHFGPILNFLNYSGFDLMGHDSRAFSRQDKKIKINGITNEAVTFK